MPKEEQNWRTKQKKNQNWILCQRMMFVCDAKRNNFVLYLFFGCCCFAVLMTKTLFSIFSSSGFCFVRRSNFFFFCFRRYVSFLLSVLKIGRFCSWSSRRRFDKFHFLFDIFSHFLLFRRWFCGRLGLLCFRRFQFIFVVWRQRIETIA